MMKRHLLPFALSLVAASPLARAQQSDPQSQPDGTFSAAASALPIAGGSVESVGVSVTENATLTVGYRISRMLNVQVHNDKGEKIGKTEDFIVAPDGTVTYAIIDVGGFLGIHTHRVAIPVSHFSAVTPRLVLPGQRRTP